MPGSAAPSRNSSDAPPPVDRWSNAVLEPELRDGRQAVAAADHGEGVGARRSAVATAARPRARTARARTRPSARSTGSVLALGDGRARTPRRSRGPMSSPIRSRGIVRGGRSSRRASAAISAAATTSSGSWIATPRSVRAPRSASRTSSNRSRLDEALADLAALGGDERERHRAADQHGVDAIDRARRSSPSLSETFAPPRTATNGRSGSLAQPREDLDLPLQRGGRRPPAVPLASIEPGRATTRRVRPVRRRRTRRRRRRRRARRGARRTPDRWPPRPGRTGGSPAGPRAVLARPVDGRVRERPRPSRRGTTRRRRRGARRGARRRAPAGARRTTWPFGRPRWEASTSVRPASSSSRSVGSVARMRMSSATAPSSSGTLKSTRTKTRCRRRRRGRRACAASRARRRRARVRSTSRFE